MHRRRLALWTLTRLHPRMALVWGGVLACTAAPACAGTMGGAPEAAASPLPGLATAAAPSSAPVAAPPLCEDGDLVGCTDGCNAKRWEDCATLGSVYLDGRSVQKDEARALALFRQACDGRSARGCIRLANAHHAGLVDDPVEEVHLYELACEGGANAACLSAGQAYVEGHGVLIRPARAAALFGPACLRGNASACYELALLLLAGDGVAQDRPQALVLLSKACQLGAEPACIAEERLAGADGTAEDEDVPDLPDLPDLPDDDPEEADLE